MYSVVLATMLAAGGTTPAWGHHSACSGCYRGYAACSCYYGCSCSGCYGCYSSCYSGCYVRTHHHHHHGYYGCYGCYGCYSSCYSGCCYVSPCYSSGCTGCYGCCGGVVTGGGPAVIEVPSASRVPYVNQEPAAVASITSPAGKNARVTVALPAEARLWVDAVECPLTSSTRSFITPELNANQKYFYNLKMEVAREGRTVTETRRVLITPGQEATVDFNSPPSVAAATR